ncbi:MULTISPECIES: protein translocase subunit SecF [Mycolicibacter]|uniref:Protein-export membrane protein SecF n=1 Tax=Mycolicibacter virginiensis TaxID=1795032 RepID=A0A9X7P0M4_9MYCO|nr:MULTISPECIES: protein translocase subunit SecF [Mycolicibacter]OBG39830.1 protein-export membrane protein SecF [Mycolicibacter heraklionensis]OBJ29121.1 protein-export membrane protein SecF [Mycolicibacter heraklionensis]PQM54277.1 protein translocase subunit SecF [Mycolicibacter virginiensis]ULP45824.1 protein translocase subunit SecF [Mycolicibacter virginiensis]
MAKPSTSSGTKRATKSAKNDTAAVEGTKSRAAAQAKPRKTAGTTKAPKHGFLSRLYTGTGAFEVIGKRRMWYAISGAMVAIAIVSILVRGFTFGIDFAGGTKVSFPRGDTSVTQVEEVFRKSVGSSPESVVVVGNGNSATVQIRAETLTNEQTEKLRDDLFDAFQPVGPNGEASKQAISDSAVSETWGGQITKKAVIALVVFLLLASLYITVRYEWFMTISAMISMVFDILVTAGVYSLVGFEVTPATVIGLLTILGFSIYDTVIVFDKVEENTSGFEHKTRYTYAEQANLAINQTFMRSINTSLISALPIISLMVVAVWLLGVGTLQDLALVQLVGVVVGTYSSIYLATPLLVTLRERTQLVQNHTRRVMRRRNATTGSKPAAAGTEDSGDADDTVADADEATVATAPGTPTPGAKPVRPTSRRSQGPTGKPGTGR